MQERNVPTYMVSVEAGMPKFEYFGVQAAVNVLSPEMAVQALRKHRLPAVYVEITQHCQNEVNLYWQQPEVEPTTLVQHLRTAYLNQQGDLLFVPRTVVSELIAGLTDPYTHLDKYLLPHAQLTPTERRILARLEMMANTVLDYREVLRVADCSNIESLWVHIRRLRKKLDPKLAILRSVRSVGYYLETAIVPSGEGEEVAI